MIRNNAKRLFFLAATVMLCATHAIAWDRQADSHGKYDNCYDRPTYFPDFTQPSTWANAEYYLVRVQLRKNSKPIENYEVAVYDQSNQLRHCSRSIAEDNHLCVLTIRGEEGDTFHFKVIYGNDFQNPKIAEVENVVIPFKTNDIVGGDTPFILTIEGDYVDGIHTSAIKEKPACRDLQGRLVKQPKKGIYIVEGKKVVIK
ncbi:hypothetical protein [Xylanibacter brevis]|uniref:hypothetical protein n=1 Tax=Xylanibacter brevis TaxID=83231 RepID=UPI0012DEE3F8|nr:hypothetical protein [Xylanibacter brevis]